MLAVKVLNGPVVRIDTLGGLVEIVARSTENGSLIIVQLLERGTTRMEDGSMRPFTYGTDLYAISLRNGLIRSTTVEDDDRFQGKFLRYDDKRWQVIVAILTHRLTGEEMYQTLKALDFDVSGVKNIIRAYQGGYMAKLHDDSIVNLWSLVKV